MIISLAKSPSIANTSQPSLAFQDSYWISRKKTKKSLITDSGTTVATLRSSKERPYMTSQQEKGMKALTRG
jgi:hypothetical protein